MVKKVNAVVFSVVVCCLLLLVYNQRTDIPEYKRPLHYTELIEPESNTTSGDNLTFAMREVIRRQRYLIEQETKDYRFPPGTKLANYTPATNGKPVRSVIITTWRSGSTFLGEVLNSVPGNFYHYEPLLEYGIVQIRGEPFTDGAIANLKRLLQCNYGEMERYLDYGKVHEYLFTHNTRLWGQCGPRNVCWNSKFLEEFCKLFPFQSMKVVRLRLKLAEELLRDEQLNVKVLLLIRDPRGVMQSRKHRDWCPGQPDCDNPSLLCADMVSDYGAAVQLQDKYPNTFRAIRYEDLSLNTYKMVPDLLRFLGVSYHPDVRTFLDSHTKLNMGGVSSTFRDSKSAPFHWRLDLNLTEVQYVEDSCGKAMRLWGYLKVEGDLREFNPLDSYTIN